MKISIKLLLLGLFTPLFIGVSFGYISQNHINEYNLEYVSDISWSGQINNVFTDIVSDINFYCYTFNSGLSVSTSNRSIQFYSSIDRGWLSSTSTPLYNYPKFSPDNSNIYISNSYTLTIKSSTTLSDLDSFYSDNFFCFYPYSGYTSVGSYGFFNSIYLRYITDSNFPSLILAKYRLKTSSSDCSETESQLTDCISNLNTALDRVNTLNGQVGTLSGNLQTCNSDLATCTNSCDVSVSQCRESLSGCQSDLSNMTNYNDSLNSQLQECLANSPIPDTPCEGTGCDEIISGTNTMFSMFRSVEDMMYSLPLSNNIYLPRGYRGYVDSGVVAIGEIEKKKIVIDDDSFNEINKSYYKVFTGLIFLFLTALFTYYLKKFITKFFIPKS